MNTTPLYIFDLDGTLADLKHRRHFVEKPLCVLCARGPHLAVQGCQECRTRVLRQNWKPNWDAFHAACVDDTPIEPVINLFTDLERMCDVLIWSGRMDTVRHETVDWLALYLGIHSGWSERLKMRPAGDYTPDDQLKESWLRALSPEDRARLVMVFDDRDRVVNMWRRNGVVCAQVAPGDF
jgi:hypothetical protein